VFSNLKGQGDEIVFTMFSRMAQIIKKYWNTYRI
jgi:hypothetical protein